MKDIEKYISPYVQDMFPSFYKDEGALFITFVKAYYEWLENNDQALYESRRLPDYRDIDKTLDQFIIDFKNKYLPNIQFNVATNKELFIKNSLDFYRAKGTERAIDLYFKLIYGLEAKVYYPADDIFSPSDNTFVKVEYLEIDDADSNINFLGQTIRGQKSGTIGFADRLIKVKKGSRFITVLFVGGLNGDFITGEQIVTTTLINNVTAKILGSLSSVDIIRSDPNFEVGETLRIVDGTVSARGKKGKLRVTETQSFTGVVDFELQNSGWGFSNTAQILGSDNVLTLNNINFTDTNYLGVNEIFPQFDRIIQDNVVFNVANSSVNIYDTPLNTVFDGYFANGDLAFQATLIEKIQTTNQLTFNFDYGDYPVVWSSTTQGDILETIDADTLYKTNDNTVFIEFSSYLDAFTSAQIIDSGKTIKVTYDITANTDSNALGSLTKQDVVYQIGLMNGIETTTANATIIDTAIDGSNYVVTLEKGLGAFRSNLSFYKVNDSYTDAEYTITDISEQKVGVVFTGGETDNFFKYGTSRTQTREGDSTSTTGLVDLVSGYDVKAEFDIVSYENTETYVDYVSNTTINAMTTNLSVAIDSADFALANTIDEEFTFENIILGGISSISVLNPGQGYAEDPFFIVHEPRTFHLERYDYVIKYTSEEQAFRVGELIQTVDGNGDPLTPENGGAIAKVVENDSLNRTLRATRVSTSSYGLSAGEQFSPGSVILGLSSGISDTIETVNENRRERRTGTNAIILTPSFSGDGFVSNVEVIDSGFGYFEDEELIGESSDDVTKTIRFKTNIEKQGVAPGYNLNRKSFLSSDKYLQDSDYYQEYSYEVLTSLPFETYKKTLIDVLHVAGTKLFGSYFATVEDSINIDINAVTTTYEIIKYDIFVNENQFFSHTIS
jgi:hypothetical protein